MIRVCAVCGRAFEGYRNQKFCSPECGAIRRAEREAVYRCRREMARCKGSAPALSFADIFAEQTRIRREEGVYLTYGQVVERVEKR